MKKYAYLALTIIGIVASFYGFSFGQTEAYIEEMIERGIVKGDAKGDLHLETLVSRAEMSAFFVRFLDQDAISTYMFYDSKFTDVQKGDWYCGYVNLLSGSGIISGYLDHSFRPNHHITLAEAAAMCIKMEGKREIKGPWPAAHMLYAKEKGIFEGLDVNNFNRPIKRKEALRMLYNMMPQHQNRENQLKGLVIANDRTEAQLQNQVRIRVIDGPHEKLSQFRDKEFLYKVYNQRERENLLGKVVDLSFSEDKLSEIKESDYGRYMEGPVDKVSEDFIFIHQQSYNLGKRRDFSKGEKNIAQIYYHGLPIDIEALQKLDLTHNFARITIKENVLLFMEIFTYDTVSVVEQKYVNVIYYKDSNLKETKRALSNKDLVFKMSLADGFHLSPIESEEFKEGDTIYLGKGFMVRYGEGRKEGKLSGMDLESANPYLMLGEEKYALQFVPNQPILYRDEKKKETKLTQENYKSILKALQDARVLIHVDHLGYILSIEKAGMKNRYFGVITSVERDGIFVRDQYNFNQKLYFKKNTKIFRMDVAFVNELSERKTLLREADLSQIKQKDVCLFQMNAQTKEVEQIIALDLNDAWRYTDYFDRYEIKLKEKSADAHQRSIYSTDETAIFVMGNEKVLAYENAKLFLEDYKVLPSSRFYCVVIPFASHGRDAEIIIANPYQAYEEGQIQPKEKILKILSIDASLDGYQILAEDIYQKKIRYGAKSARIIKTIEDKAVQEGDIIQAQIIDLKVPEMREALSLVKSDGKNCYKVLEIERDALVLGFGRNKEDGILSFYPDHYAKIKIEKNPALFGDIKVGSIIQLHFSKGETADVVRVCEGFPNLSLSTIPPYAKKSKISVVYRSLNVEGVMVYEVLIDDRVCDFKIDRVKFDGEYYPTEGKFYIVTLEKEIALDLYSEDYQVDTIRLEKSEVIQKKDFTIGRM